MPTLMLTTFPSRADIWSWTPHRSPWSQIALAAVVCFRHGGKSQSRSCILTSITPRSICLVSLSRKSKMPLKLHPKKVSRPIFLYPNIDLPVAALRLPVLMIRKVSQVNLEPLTLALSMKLSKRLDLVTGQLKSLTGWFVQR